MNMSSSALAAAQARFAKYLADNYDHRHDYAFKYSQAKR